MTQQEFIKEIAGYCQKYAQKYGFKIASAAIAQACLESAYGTSSKAKHHNYFGLKYKPNRVTVDNGQFTDGSAEQNPNGSYINISTQWFSFATMEAGVEGYYQFINISNYAKVKIATTPKEYLTAIKNAGYATSLKYVDNVMAVVNKWNLTQYDDFKTTTSSVIQSKNSPLIDCTVKSQNHSGRRTHAIDRITPHCVVGQLTAEAIGNCFKPGRQASCNYGIGKDGRVCLIVDEENRSWCSSNAPNDQRAITIECASDKTEPYAFNDAVYDKLIQLCIDICRRYGKKRLIWIDNKEKALAYTPEKNEMLLTVHRWFAKKSCPGNWMYSRMGDLATKVSNALDGGTTIVEITPKPESTKPVTPLPKPVKNTSYIVQVTVSALNYRSGPGVKYKVNGTIRDKGRYTIVEEKDGWGKLKSGAGWINLSYTKKV